MKFAKRNQRGQPSSRYSFFAPPSSTSPRPRLVHYFNIDCRALSPSGNYFRSASRDPASSAHRFISETVPLDRRAPIPLKDFSHHLVRRVFPKTSEKGFLARSVRASSTLLIRTRDQPRERTELGPFVLPRLLPQRLPPSVSQRAPFFFVSSLHSPRPPPSQEKINPFEPRAVSLWVLLRGNIYERSRMDGARAHRHAALWDRSAEVSVRTPRVHHATLHFARSFLSRTRKRVAGI